MSRLSLPLSLVILISWAHLIQAQCVTPSYVPCFPAGTESGGSSGVPQDDFDDTGFWDSLQSVASSPIGKRDVLRHQLSSRQNALCCAPTNQCLILTDGNIPFCYVSPRHLLFSSKRSLPRSRLGSTTRAEAEQTEPRHHQILLLGRQLWLRQQRNVLRRRRHICRLQGRILLQHGRDDGDFRRGHSSGHIGRRRSRRDKRYNSYGAEKYSQPACDSFLCGVLTGGESAA